MITLNIKQMLRQNLLWTFILSIVLLTLNVLVHKPYLHFSFGSILFDCFIFFVLYSILIILHEIFHLIGFMLFGKAPFSSLSYGIKLDQGIAYATTNKLLTNRAMKASLMLPFWMTGVIPTVLGFFINSNMLILVGSFLMAGAVGDFMMYKQLRKYPNHYLVKDDPNLPRLTVYPVPQDK